MDPVIEATQLTKRYGSLLALDALDLRVEEGTAYGLVGGDGAGKTTVVRLFAGLSTPTRGTVRILGRTAARDDPDLRRRTGVMLEELALFDYLTAEEYLAFLGRQLSLEKTMARKRASELLALLDLKSVSVRTIAGYSHSMRRRLALSAALLHRPELLILDDPFEGFDASCRATFQDLLPELCAPDVTLFLTATSPLLLEGVCARIGVVKRGRLVMECARADLSRSFAPATLSSLRPE